MAAPSGHAMSAMNNACPSTMQQLNAMTRKAFVEALGGLFEGATWVAERAWQSRPFDDADHLFAVMCHVVRASSREEQLALLRAHPALGAPGDRAIVMSNASQDEQHAAGLDLCTNEQRLELVRLNKAYLSKYGLPLVIAVRGLTVDEIIAAMVRRLAQDPDREHEAAISEAVRIASGRLTDIIGNR